MLTHEVLYALLMQCARGGAALKLHFYASMQLIHMFGDSTRCLCVQHACELCSVNVSHECAS